MKKSRLEVNIDFLFDFDAKLALFWRHFGRPGRLWGHLGASWARLGASWGLLGGVLGHLGSVSGHIPRKNSVFDRFLLPTSIPET